MAKKLMAYKKYLFLFFLLTLFLLDSCLYTRYGGASYVIKNTITVNYGNIIMKVHGQINENVYLYNTPSERINDIKYYDNPLINEGTRSRNETKYLSAGEKYTVSVLPSEVVTVNITSVDNNDAEIHVSGAGKDKIYTVSGTDRLGLFIAFQNK